MTSKTTDELKPESPISFIRPRTGKEYVRIDGVWYLNGKRIPDSGKGNRAAQWQIEGEYQATQEGRGKDDVD